MSCILPGIKRDAGNSALLFHGASFLHQFRYKIPEPPMDGGGGDDRKKRPGKSGIPEHIEKMAQFTVRNRMEHGHGSLRERIERRVLRLICHQIPYDHTCAIRCDWQQFIDADLREQVLSTACWASSNPYASRQFRPSGLCLLVSSTREKLMGIHPFQHDPAPGLQLPE